MRVVLLSGGLPTFIDIKDNFVSSAVDVDNVLLQLRRAGKRLLFAGDDTWMSLYPQLFHQAAPMPSFNVKDLHTVDQGCHDMLNRALNVNITLHCQAQCQANNGAALSTASSESDAATTVDAITPAACCDKSGNRSIALSDWDALFVHYLGVDHVGEHKQQQYTCAL